MSQVSVTAVILFSVGLELKDEGKGGKESYFVRKQCIHSFSEDILLMASLKNHQRFLRETKTNKQKLRLRFSIQR